MGLGVRRYATEPASELDGLPLLFGHGGFGGSLCIADSASTTALAITEAFPCNYFCAWHRQANLEPKAKPRTPTASFVAINPAR